MKNPPQSKQGNSWDARTLGKVARALGKERKPRGEVPTVGRGAWVFRHHFIQLVSQHIFDDHFPSARP